jgi:hypothetical protein
MKIVLVAAAVIALFVLGRALDAQAWLAAALKWIRGIGVWAPLIFVLLYVAACVLLLPGSVLTPRARTPTEWAFYGAGLLATVAVTVYVTRVARVALAKRAAV